MTWLNAGPLVAPETDTPTQRIIVKTERLMKFVRPKALPMPTPTTLKTRLKPALVPIWNAVYRFNWLLIDYASSLRSGRVERCAVCGRLRLLIYRRRVLTPRLAELWGLSTRLAEAFARKESLECTHCGAKLRGRRMAQVLLSLFPAGKPPAPSLAQWVLHPEVQHLRVAEINTIDGLHLYMRKLP